ncbi:MAG TPA: glycosyltransferase family 1 protein, partial [Armatimonadetes bacterium]|nr:glycosyltransferase family 1 protein [Armatimonadota bacterium]
MSPVGARTLGRTVDEVKPDLEQKRIILNSNVRASKSLRILGLCPHPVQNLTATTGYGGVSSHFFQSLARRHEVILSEVQLKGLAHYANRLRSFIMQPHAWRQYAGKNPWIFQARSRIAHQLVKQLNEEIDLVIQRQGLNAPFIGQPLKPYAIYTDYTTKLGDSHNHSTYRNSIHRNTRERETYYHLEGEAYRKARRVFTYNKLVRRSMIEDYGVDPEKVITVGVGVCLEPIDPAIEKRYDSRQIVFIGKDSAFIRKGVPNLLAGFALVREVIPDAQLLLIGLSPDRIPPQPGVVNLGFIKDRQRLRQVLKDAALYAMTPLIDPSPGAVREAMAMKLPVVASNVDGIPEMVVDGETGYLVPPEEPKQLAQTILSLLQDENKMRSMGERGYARVLEYF